MVKHVVKTAVAGALSGAAVGALVGLALFAVADLASAQTCDTPEAACDVLCGPAPVCEQCEPQTYTASFSRCIDAACTRLYQTGELLRRVNGVTYYQPVQAWFYLR